MTRVQAHHSEICPQKFSSDGMDKICLNVGGQKHETYLSTIGHLPDTRLYWIIESVVKSPDYDPEASEIFFDRHPSVFAQVLNYYRTGKLHCPTDVCGPLFEQELNYWGIDEKDMEPCCWANYTQHRDAEENLKNVLYEGTSEDAIGTENVSMEQQPSGIMHIWRKIQPPIWTMLDESRSSKRAKVFSFISVLFIVVSVAMFCINTLPELESNTQWRTWCDGVEGICGIFFTLEFLLRALFCPNKRAFVFSWATWVDFFAVIPFYLKLIVQSSSRSAINVLLVIRLLRLFRFFRLIYGLQVLSHTLKASSYELVLLLFMLFIPVVIFSSMVYFIEHSLNNGDTKFRSIPHSFWWSLITITTVGYGDMHPVSWPGKIVGCMCAICGVLIVALPVSIIGGNFTLFYTHAQARLKLPKKKNKVFLPHSATGVYRNKRSLSRTKAIRRKVSKRPSDTCDMANQTSRGSSVQGPSLTGFNGYPKHLSRHSSCPTDAVRTMPRKTFSAVSIRVPLHDDLDDMEGEDRVRPMSGIVHSSLSPPDWEYPKLNDPLASQASRNNNNTVDDRLILPIFMTDKFDEISNEYSSDKDIEVDPETRGSRETSPLLSSSLKLERPGSKDGDKDDDNVSRLGNVMVQLNQGKQLQKQLSVEEDSQDNVASTSDNARHARENWDEGSIKLLQHPNFPSISEASIEYRPSSPSSEPAVNDPNGEDDSITVDTSADEIHFNRRRRNPVF